ncbi:hypothetical protein [Amycolatopsis sp. NPDC052450]|uniref:hypothetical protein n=1 Tax=Amycolatopsis sp. NPDC052450 TaxID=3363937 RepID=UPI0037C5599C
MRLNDVVGVLEHVRKVGASNLGDDDANVAALLQLVHTANLAAAALPRPSQVVSALLRDAIASEAITSRYSKAEQNALLVAFGTSGTHIDKGKLTEREKRAARILGIAYGSYRKPHVRHQRLGDVAEAILSLVEKHRYVLVAAPAEQEPFVPRPQLENRFRELLRSHSPVIAFAGPPSVGKRTLARRLTDEYRAPGSSVVRLLGSSQEALQQSIIAELDRLAVQNINYHVPRHSLRELVLSPSSPRFVVIEDAGDIEIAQFLTATKTDTTVVLTTTHRLPGIDHIEVGEMAPAESAALLSLVLPAITPEDAASLADDLGHHPLALLVTAALVAEDQADVSEFRRGLRRTVTGLLDAAAGFPSLPSVHRTAIDRLSQDARAMLEMLVYLDPSPIPTAFVVRAIADYRGLQDANVVHVRMLARSALRALRDHYLIRIVNDQVTVPAITRALVIDSTHDSGAQTAERSRASLLALVRLLRADHPDMPLLDFVRMCSPLIIHLRTTFLDPWKNGGSLAEHLYHYSQALGHFLTAASQPSWRLAVIALQTSEDGFSVILLQIPEKADGVRNLGLKVQFSNPDPVEFQLNLPNWCDRKRMQLLLISQTLEVDDILSDPELNVD